MIWKVEIEKVQNGFIFKTISDEEEVIEEKYVYSWIDEDDRYKQFEVLLYDISEYFAMIPNKHDDIKLLIEYEDTSADDR